MLFSISGIFWILNGGAYAKEIKYWVLTQAPWIAEDLNSDENIVSIPQTANIRSNGGEENYFLSIPKISVGAPVVRAKGNSNAHVLAALEEGVGLYPDSNLPGQPGGRAVILGHSSRATWYRGGYATIFALLSKLKPNDTFTIKHGDTNYRYEVVSQQTLTPHETNVFLARPISDNSEVVLITCYPIGSSSKRTVVLGKLIN